MFLFSRHGINETSLKRQKKMPRTFDLSERFTDNVNNKQRKI